MGPYIPCSWASLKSTSPSSSVSQPLRQSCFSSSFSNDLYAVDACSDSESVSDGTPEPLLAQNDPCMFPTAIGCTPIGPVGLSHPISPRHLVPTPSPLVGIKAMNAPLSFCQDQLGSAGPQMKQATACEDTCLPIPSSSPRHIPLVRRGIPSYSKRFTNFPLVVLLGLTECHPLPTLIDQQGVECQTRAQRCLMIGKLAPPGGVQIGGSCQTQLIS